MEPLAADIRARGHHVVRQRTDDVASLAAPVGSGDVIAALTLTGPATAITDDERLIGLLAGTAERLAERCAATIQDDGARHDR
jgi:DNA-binding IclR family transcriptional regulator